MSFYFIVALIGAAASFFLNWRFLSFTSLVLFALGAIGLIFFGVPHVFVRAVIGLAVLQLSYLTCGLATESWRPSRESDKASSGSARRSSEAKRRQYRAAPGRRV